MNSNQAISETGVFLDIQQQNDNVLERLKQRSDRFIGVNEGSGSSRYYDKHEVISGLRNDLINGRHQRDSSVVVYAKKEDGTWDQTKTNIDDFVRSDFDLRVLYHPVWSYAMAGLKWGALAGVAIKLADTALMLAYVNPGFAFLFLVAIGVCFIPSIGVLGVCLISFFMIKYSHVNFFLMGSASAFVGAALGCLPGMAIGGIIGLSRRNGLPRAQDAQIESPSIMLNAFVLPLLGTIGLWAFYIFVFNPWLMNYLQ